MILIFVPYIHSVERLYNQLVESGQPALEPLIITNSGG